MLSNKKIIVTGGSYGMGASIVAALAAHDATVAVMARSVDLGEELAARVSRKGPGKARFYRCDVSDRSQVKQAFAAAVADMGGLDGLVHVAGVEGGGLPEQETDEDWERIFDINARGTFVTNQEAFPYLKEKGGRILNFGSGAATTGLATSAVYAASKGAVSSWTRSVAMAWGQHNIAVNVVLPSVWTPMYDAYRARFTPEELKAHDEDMRKMIPLGGRLGDPDTDLAPVIIFLMSDGARKMTGQSFSIDGGAVMVR